MPAPTEVGFDVIELRRYTIRDGQRERFARYFETYFPEAFQQLGAVALGHFNERENPSGFTWLRGFPTMDDRAAANTAFYSGPVWDEHRDTVNGLILDSDNVLLLRPLSPDRRVAALPAVDPVRDADAPRGVAVAQIFAIPAGSVEEFARRSEPGFAACRAAGAREAGVLASLDAPNNFPRHPIRTDGPFLVWLAVVEDERTLVDRVLPELRRRAGELGAAGLLRAESETVLLDPTPRSRLRWIPEEPTADSPGRGRHPG